MSAAADKAMGLGLPKTLGLYITAPCHVTARPMLWDLVFALIGFGLTLV
jgi:hypothetical protein